MKQRTVKTKHYVLGTMHRNDYPWRAPRPAPPKGQGLGQITNILLYALCLFKFAIRNPQSEIT